MENRNQFRQIKKHHTHGKLQEIQRRNHPTRLLRHIFMFNFLMKLDADEKIQEKHKNKK